MKGEESRVCHASEASLHDYAETVLRKSLNEALTENAQLPGDARERLLDADAPLSLDEWRAMFKTAFDDEIQKEAEQEFGDASIYGDDGARAREGRNLAISIFLPPVALGFSVLVCILHLASALAMLSGHPLIWTAFGIALVFTPLLFSPSLPLGGFAGTYAGWLVEWEAFLYPFGIFRSLIS